MGRIGRKDKKTLKNGGEMTTLHLATSRKYTNSSGEKRELTTWHNVNFFNILSDIVSRYAHVGDLIHIEGEIKNKRIESGERIGQWAYSVTGSEVTFIPTGKKSSEDMPLKPLPEENSTNSTNSTNSDNNCEFYDDLVPF